MSIHSKSCTDHETCNEQCTAPPAFRAPAHLTGYAAISHANAYCVTLSKYADPTEGARTGLSPSEARQIAREDPSLIWCEVTALTADTITDEQIRQLRDEASDADDDKQVDLCRLALGMTPTIAWNLTPYGARGRCADAINAARAQES